MFGGLLGLKITHLKEYRYDYKYHLTISQCLSLLTLPFFETIGFSGRGNSDS